MKKLAYLIIITIIFISPINAAEKKNCSGIKKLSKEFIACKAGNLKTGLKNTGNKFKISNKKQSKKKDITKPKKVKKKKVINVSKIKKSTKKNTESLKETVAGAKMKIKNSLNKIWSGTTKKYPKGTQK